MEPPECPVCLQSYDGAATVPRVLACGHSACESCLALLPARPALPDAVRCPSCTQLVPLPRRGPSALPKNIDLLRFSNPNPNPKPESESEPESSPVFLPLPFTEQLISAWKDWILPPDSISLASIGSGTATISSRLARGNQQKVSLFPIASSPSSSSARPRWLRPSYTVRVMETVSRLGEMVRTQLGFLLEASSSQRRGLCRVYGLWMDPAEEGPDSPLFLVCERFDRSISDLLKNEGRESGFGVNYDEKLGTWMVVLELCEVVMGLHLKGIVLGSLAPDCFCFDEFGHCVIDLNSVFFTARGIREGIRVASSSGKGNGDCNPTKTQVLLSPEVFASLHDGASGFDGLVGYGSDSWSLASILAIILIGDPQFDAELFEGFYCLLSGGTYENVANGFLEQYEVWREKVSSKLEALMLKTRFESLFQILSASLSYHPQSRPQVKDIWCCIRGLFIKHLTNHFAAVDDLETKKNVVSCLVLEDFCSLPKQADKVLPQQGSNGGGSDTDHLPQGQVDGDPVKGLEGGGFKSVTLQAHHDCITGLAIGGGYLFSSSFDKTVNVWSLQDFSHVQSLRGHEHRVMALIVVDGTQPFCISGDSGSGIFVWCIGTSLGQELVKKWYEHSDWRYSGVHSLAISGTGYLYTGSGDKSIKAWSLQDYSLSCIMTGHKSTVSSLAVADGILYSGSWDGTIRLWRLNDHSLLSVLEDDTPGSSPPVLSLYVDSHLVIASYENGYLKIWRNDVLARSVEIQDGAIFALHMDSKWLFTGGWNKIVDVQELLESELQVDIRPAASIACDSAITSLIYWHGKLFVGLSSKEIKVYSHWS